MSRLLALSEEPRWRIAYCPNTYRRARIACRAWLKGSLWGNPITLSLGNIHVYGCWRRDWSQVHVQFTDKYIIVIKPIGRTK